MPGGLALDGEAKTMAMFGTTAMGPKDDLKTKKKTFNPRVEVFSAFRAPFAQPAQGVVSVEANKAAACCACTACTACR